jgi:hypothetical protein
MESCSSSARAARKRISETRVLCVVHATAREMRELVAVETPERPVQEATPMGVRRPPRPRPREFRVCVPGMVCMLSLLER